MSFSLTLESKKKIEDWAKARGQLELLWIARAVARHKEKWPLGGTTYGCLSIVFRDYMHNERFVEHVKKLMKSYAKVKDSTRWWYIISPGCWQRLGAAEQRQIAEALPKNPFVKKLVDKKSEPAVAFDSC